MITGEQKINLSGLLPDFHSLSVYPETADQLSAQFVAVLIVVFVFFFFISLLALFKANLRINWVRKLIKNETSQSVVMNRQELLDKAFKVKNNAGHLWKEFDETLIEARVGNDVHLHNIYDASHFFNNSSLASGITESRMLAAVPGFLTALGVIGTFVGLQLGLSKLNIGNDVAIEDMKAGLAHVISGAKIAFMTSVWGVTLSVLFNFIEKWFESIVRSRIHHLQVRIDELFPRFSAEVQLQKIAEDGAESLESLQGLAERIGVKMQESLIEATSGIQQGLEASLEKIMAPAINKLVNETTDGSQKALEQLVEGFLNKFGEQGESQRQAMDAASKGVGDVLISMNQTLDGFIQKLDQNQNTLAEREKKLIEHISRQVDKLVEKNAEHGQLLVTVTKQQIEKITESIEQSCQAQEERETKLEENFERVVTNMGESIDSQASASSSLMEQGKALQQRVETSQTNLETMAESITAGVTELHSAGQPPKEYGEGVKQSTQQLGGVIKDAASSTAELADENKKSAIAVGQIHHKISNDIENLNGVIEKLKSVVKAADSTFDHLEKHQKSYLDALNRNVKELAEQGTQLLKDYAEQANAQTKDHLGIWAKHTTSYAEQMNKAARALSAVVDEIEDKVGR